MDASVTTAEQITQAYARLKARGIPLGTPANPKTFKQHNESGKLAPTLNAAIPALKEFAPEEVSKVLITADKKPITYPRLVSQWVAIAFNPEESTVNRMRALEKLERILVAVASAHPALGPEVDSLSKTARRAARNPASDEGRQAAQSAASALGATESLKYADFVKARISG